MITKLKENERLRSWFLLNFAISFMFCIFAPLDAYYATMDEFWFSLPQMMAVCGIVFLILLLILDLLALLLHKTGISDFLFAGCTVLFFFFYIQGNFIPRNYGALTGAEINWAAYPGYAAASIILGLVSLILFVLLLKKFRSHLNSFGRLLSFLTLCMMAGTAIILMVQNGIPSKKSDAVVTDAGLWDFSSDRNVIILMLDSYDGDFFEYTYNENPDDTAAIYENFTWYKDTLSHYCMTHTSVPFLLTGIEYLNREPYKDYIKTINLQHPLYQTLQENGYESYFYTYPEFFNTDAALPANVIEGTYIFSNAEAFAGTIFKLIGFYYAPHQLKPFFDINTEAFSKCRKAEQNVTTFDWEPTNFAYSLEQNGISITKIGPLLKFIHLKGCHAPYNFGAELNPDGKKYTPYETAAGNNEVLRRYFKALKAAGIYDSSTIIVMADHGGRKDSLNNPLREGKGYFQQYPIFMIKNSNEKHPFAVSDAEMSYEYLPDLFQTLITGEPIDETMIRSLTPKYGKRRFLYYNSVTSTPGYLAPIKEMLCDGPAYEEKSLQYSGKVYTAADQNSYAYALNEYASFKEEFLIQHDAYRHIKYGSGPMDTAGMYLTENFLMHFDIVDETYENLHVIITLNESNTIPWKYTILANQQTINEVYQSEDFRTVSFFIPKQVVSNGELDLHCFLNGKDNMDGAEISTEMLAEGIIISSVPDALLTDSSQNITNYYYLGKNLNFASRESLSASVSYQQNELSDPSEYGMEITGMEASMHFSLIEKTGDLLALMKYQAPEEGIHVRIYANDALVYEVNAGGIETIEMSISQDIISDSNTFTLRIELLKDAESSMDSASSGFYLKSLTIEKDSRTSE